MRSSFSLSRPRSSQVISSGGQLIHSPRTADQMKSWPIATQPPPPNDGASLAQPFTLVMSGMASVTLRAEQALTAPGGPGPRPAPAGASADLDSGQQRVRSRSPTDRITVAERVLSRQKGAIEGEPVHAQVRDPPLAVGEREPGMLPGHRRHFGKSQFNGPPSGTGAGHPGFRHRATRDQPQYREQATDCLLY